jgi:flagellar basal-body rod protein FlgG
VAPDGVVLSDGRVLGQVALYAAPAEKSLASEGGALFVFEGEGVRFAGSGAIRQGMLEASNTDLGDEMMALMEAQRRAEAGAQTLRTFDAMVEQSIAAFGRTGR